MKKLLCGLLCVIFLASCSDTGLSKEPEAPESSAISPDPVLAETEIPETEMSAPSYPAGLSFDGADFTFGVVVNTNARNAILMEEMTGEVLNDAQYTTVAETNEALNVKIGEYTMTTGYPAANGIIPLITAGDDVVQVANVYCVDAPTLMGNGYARDYAEIPYIDLTKPWWVEAYTNGVNLNGSVMTVCGDCALSSFSNANVIFFNKSVMDDRSIAYPYDDALEGKWTLDKMLSLSESVTADLDGDGKISLDDLHGLCAYNNSIQPFFSACGLAYTEENEDGIRVLLTPSERLLDAADRRNAFCHTDSFIDSNSAYQMTGVNTEPAMHEHFKEGKYLFMGLVLEGIEALRDMEVDFGILPYPKYDEEQSRYYTTILRRYTVSAVPISASSADNSALILEALSSEGYRSVIPRYYEIALKGKYVRDESSSQVLDLIKDSLYLEFVDLYYNDLGFSDFFAGYVMTAAEGTYMSQFQSNQKVWAKKLETLYKAYE